MAVTAADLLKPIPVETSDVEIEGLGTVRIRPLTLAAMNANEAWQRPGGVANKWRIENNRWKLTTGCLVDDNDNPLFDFTDSKDGDARFKEFVETIGQGGIGYWNDLRYEVMVVNGWIKEDDDDEDLLGKS